MTFPTINFKFNDLPEAQALRDLVEQKCATLEKYLNNAGSVICDVEFKKSAPQQNGQVHKIGAKIIVDGATFWAEATEDSFEKAIDKVRAELDQEMRRAKEKSDTLQKQGGREAKEQLLGVQ